MPLWLTCEIVSWSLSQADFLSSLPHAAADVARLATRAQVPAIRIGVLRIELDSFQGLATSCRRPPWCRVKIFRSPPSIWKHHASLYVSGPLLSG
jgi:hypothetical protein